MFNSNIHRGVVLQVIKPSEILVWIPTKNGSLSIGKFDYLGANTGGVMYGKNLSNSLGTAVKCKICTPLVSGAWFQYSSVHEASAFTNKSNLEQEDFIDLRLNPNWSQRRNNGMSNLQYKSDTPAVTLSACSPTLNVSGGTPIPNIGNMPPGHFPLLDVGQHVLVAYITSSNIPIIIGTLPTDKEFEATLG